MTSLGSAIVSLLAGLHNALRQGMDKEPLQPGCFEHFL